MGKIWVDADACAVKDEIYRVAKRYEWQVTLVANAWLNITESEWLKLVVVRGHLDAADDWIAEHVTADEIVVTSDIPLAARCLEKQARVLDGKGNEFTESSIGSALASRDLMATLREAGVVQSGPAPFSPKDRSQFLQRLDQTIQSIRRSR